MEKSFNVIESLNERIDSKVQQIQSVSAHLKDLRSELFYLNKLKIRIAKGEDAAAKDELNEVAEKIAEKTPALKAGMVIVFDNNGNRHVIASADYNAENYPLSEYTPEAVLARRANGEWQMLSLVNMCCKHPESGSIDPEEEGCRMPFGGALDESGKLVGERIMETHYDDNGRYQVLIDRDGEENGHSYYGYIASSKFANEDGDKSAIDGKKYYYNDNDHYLPLSINADGTSNKLFGKGQNEPSFLSDNDIEGNNEAILNKATRQKDWRTAAEIDNNAYLGNYPAAECCARYKTAHLTEWGMPTAPDLACIMEDWAEIQDGLMAVKKVAPNLAVQLHDNYYYWSSSEYNSFSAYVLSTNLGGMSGDYKDNYDYVRAVCRFRI